MPQGKKAVDDKTSTAQPPADQTQETEDIAPKSADESIDLATRPDGASEHEEDDDEEDGKGRQDLVYGEIDGRQTGVQLQGGFLMD